jgi:type II secretory pathway predicted ATPase ExeA
MKRRISPFSISPNPITLYLTPALEAAAYRINYTVEHRQGLTAILGEVGTGKSSIIRRSHAEFDAMPDVTSVLIPSPTYKTEYAMIQGIAQLFGLPARKGTQQHLRELETWLAEQFIADQVVILFIDEAQKLDHKMLELVRALLNFETDEAKLIQIVLAGQLELRDRLVSDKQKPLYTRLTMPTVLAPLSPTEVSEVISFRCKHGKISNPFPIDASTRIYELSGGIPREVLRLCTVAYEMGQLAGMKSISPDLIDSAFRELQLRDGDGDVE